MNLGDTQTFSPLQLGLPSIPIYRLVIRIALKFLVQCHKVCTCENQDQNLSLMATSPLLFSESQIASQPFNLKSFPSGLITYVASSGSEVGKSAHYCHCSPGTQSLFDQSLCTYKNGYSMNCIFMKYFRNVEKREIIVGCSLGKIS